MFLCGELPAVARAIGASPGLQLAEGVAARRERSAAAKAKAPSVVNPDEEVAALEAVEGVTAHGGLRATVKAVPLPVLDPDKEATSCGG